MGKLRPMILIIVIMFCIGIIFDLCRSMNHIDTPTFNIWFQHSAYNRIRPGMTKQQTFALLGKPDRERLNIYYELWEYPLYPNADWLHGAIVSFDPSGRVTGVVTDDVKIPPKKVWPGGAPRVGMTKDQVRSLCGKPRSTGGQRKAISFWKYDLWNNSTFQIAFDRNDRVVRAWTVASGVTIDW
ncbi:MAG: hypothetical protein ABFD46_11770 [Armatimonadota bacterium]